MGTIVDKLSNLKKSTLERNTRRAADWLRNKLKSGLDKKALTSKPRIGMMYIFSYLPKHKDTLPYWDRNPLVIPIAYYPDGFLGLNLHYLPPKLRILLLDKLQDFAMGNKENRRMKLSYDLLVNSSRLKAFQPCLHRYLYSHTKSRFAIVEEDEWEVAAMLPLARFVGKSNTAVYQISRSMI